MYSSCAHLFRRTEGWRRGEFQDSGCHGIYALRVDHALSWEEIFVSKVTQASVAEFMASELGEIHIQSITKPCSPSCFAAKTQEEKKGDAQCRRQVVLGLAGTGGASIRLIVIGLPSPTLGSD